MNNFVCNLAYPQPAYTPVSQGIYPPRVSTTPVWINTPAGAPAISMGGIGTIGAGMRTFSFTVCICY